MGIWGQGSWETGHALSVQYNGKCLPKNAEQGGIANMKFLVLLFSIVIIIIIFCWFIMHHKVNSFFLSEKIKTFLI